VSSNDMSSVNISSMYMASDIVTVKHNQAELSKLETRSAKVFSHKTLGEVTGMTRLKM